MKFNSLFRLCKLDGEIQYLKLPLRSLSWRTYLRLILCIISIFTGLWWSIAFFNILGTNRLSNRNRLFVEDLSQTNYELTSRKYSFYSRPPSSPFNFLFSWWFPRNHYFFWVFLLLSIRFGTIIYWDNHWSVILSFFRLFRTLLMLFQHSRPNWRQSLIFGRLSINFMLGTDRKSADGKVLSLHLVLVPVMGKASLSHIVGCYMITWLNVAILWLYL